MRTFSIYLFLVLSYLALTQTPPIWGGNTRFSVNVSMLNNKPVMRWNFTYYYDSNLKAERYEHQAPQADEMCLMASPPFTINDSCVVTFATDGWSYIEYPQHNWCCKCEKSFGAVSSDWLKVNSTYQGIEVVNNVSVTHWTKTGLTLNNYYSTVNGALPVKFAQLKGGVPKQWDFDMKSYSTGPFDPQKLKPKCTKLCLGQCILFRNSQENSQISEQ